MLVLMEEAAETVTAADAYLGELVKAGNRFGQWCEWSGVGDALMRTVRVVERLVLAEHVQQVALVQIRVRSSNSRRQVRTHRSMIAFIRVPGRRCGRS